jgi:CheY-like chemotaxis protein
MTPLSVLVTEDESEMRNVLSQWLEHQGHKVTCARNGNEALRLLRTAAVDLLVLDILMPDGDGIEVLMELAKTKPATKTLAISGGGPYLSSADCLKLANRLGAHGVLMKPFTQAQLLAAIDGIMDADAAGAPG